MQGQNHSIDHSNFIETIKGASILHFRITSGATRNFQGGGGSGSNSFEITGFIQRNYSGMSDVGTASCNCNLKNAFAGFFRKAASTPRSAELRVSYLTMNVILRRINAASTSDRAHAVKFSVYTSGRAVGVN